jgi:hypothetical protein
LLPPEQDQGQYEDPDEPGAEADQERFGERFTAAEVVAEPGSDEPDESGHRGGRRRSCRENLDEGVLPDAVIPVKVCFLVATRAGSVGA